MISFPDDGTSYEKILMYYTLKCVPGGAGGLQYPCGEWDYLTYTFLYHPTGNYDSTLYEHPNFLVNNNAVESFDYTIIRVGIFFRMSNKVLFMIMLFLKILQKLEVEILRMKHLLEVVKWFPEVNIFGK